MGDQLLPLPLIERTATRAWTCSGYFRPKVLGRRHGWTGSCQSWRRSRTVIPKERFLPASFRPSVQTRCRACGNATTGAGGLRPASAWISGCCASGALPARHRYRQNRYSAFAEPRLIEHLRQRETDALIVSGSETDVCVLATVLDAVDIGYRSSSFATLYAAHPTRPRHAHAALSFPIYGADRHRRRGDNPRGGNDFRSGVKPPGRAD